jgi:cell division protein DivIC
MQGRPVNFRQVILTLYILLLSGLGIGGLVLFKDVHDEYAQLRQAEAADRRRLLDAQNRLRDQEKVLERLRDDPAFVDKVIRMKLGYAKPDEFIFRFEDSGVKGPVDTFSAPRN